MKGLGVLERLRRGLSGLRDILEVAQRMVGPLDVDEEAEQHESDQEELVPQQVWRHDDIPSTMVKGDDCTGMHPLANYPLVAGTPPGRIAPIVPSHHGCGERGHGLLLNSLTTSAAT